MAFLETTRFLSQSCCKKRCVWQNCVAIRATNVFSADNLWTIVLLSKEKDDNSLIPSDTTLCLPSGYHELLFLKYQGLHSDCCVWVKIASYCSSFLSVFIRDLFLSVIVLYLTWQDISAAPPIRGSSH